MWWWYSFQLFSCSLKMQADLVNQLSCDICYLSTFQIQLANLQQLMQCHPGWRGLTVKVGGVLGARCGELACSRYKGFPSSPALQLQLQLNLARIDDCNHWFVLAGPAWSCAVPGLASCSAESPGNRGSTALTVRLTTSPPATHNTSKYCSKHPALPSSSVTIRRPHRQRNDNFTHTPPVPNDYAEQLCRWRKNLIFSKLCSVE